ncbi:chorismate synthase [Brumimicrobium salinarum]|uniref:Chorismate synthase n=1 Tax=Brumimicrobium salinarum TaxID=2058658 RepID=A0A2I0R1G3_9FLAO|nr:chorismate synthase [Brumimicrobium salinarum]PKR80421.1 chorismate synthase [Brumimicrobium salinarum]
MAGNTIGHTFRLTTFGESHGEAIGGIIDGVPSNFSLDLDAVQLELDRRRPGQSDIVTQRKESDTVRFLSGVFENKTTGAPIGFVIENENQKSKDYSHIQDVYRPSHADFTYDKKYGHRDYRGGGRSSARETACRVVAGAIAKQFLSHYGISIHAFVSQIGPIRLSGDLIKISLPEKENKVRCPDEKKAAEMITYLKEIRKAGDTIGGVVFSKITGVPVGLGAPVFDKLHADLGKAMLSINAVKGFEYGSGFSGVEMKGSEHNDVFQSNEKTVTNFSGGIQGGISNGEPIYFRVAFKPVATIMQDQTSINKHGKNVTVQGKGRHDPCVVPRAVPIVEAMAAITVFDHVLRHKTTQI